MKDKEHKIKEIKKCWKCKKVLKSYEGIMCKCGAIQDYGKFVKIFNSYCSK